VSLWDFGFMKNDLFGVVFCCLHSNLAVTYNVRVWHLGGIDLLFVCFLRGCDFWFRSACVGYDRYGQLDVTSRIIDHDVGQYTYEVGLLDGRVPQCLLRLTTAPTGTGDAPAYVAAPRIREDPHTRGQTGN